MIRALSFILSAINVAALIIVLSVPANAASELKRENASRFNSEDYYLRSNNDIDDDIFDRYSTIDLGADLAIGADCGKVDFRGTLRATLRNLLDAKYFGNLGKSIMAASPMLLACYFSPTWCAVLKHTRVNANFLSQMRLDQCALIDRYVDNRVEDYHQERQSCVRQQIKRNGGNLETALKSCRNVWDVDLVDWAGGGGEKVETNRLIESSAKWAGLSGHESRRAVDMVKSFVGDTVVGRGNISIDYGPTKTPTSPRTFLKDAWRPCVFPKAAVPPEEPPCGPGGRIVSST